MLFHLGLSWIYVTIWSARRVIPVSQYSSLLRRNWFSVIGTSDFHFGRHAERFNGLFRRTVPLTKRSSNWLHGAEREECWPTGRTASRWMRSSVMMAWIISIITDTATHDDEFQRTSTDEKIIRVLIDNRRRDRFMYKKTFFLERADHRWCTPKSNNASEMSWRRGF